MKDTLEGLPHEYVKQVCDEQDAEAYWAEEERRMAREEAYRQKQD